FFVHKAAYSDIHTLSLHDALPIFDHEYLISIPLPLGDNATLRWMNFGPSFKSTSRTVNDIFRENFPISFQLGIISVIIATLIGVDRKSTRLNSSHVKISYAVFCLK